MLTKIIVERSLPVDRPSMVLVANGLRKEHSPSYLVEPFKPLTLSNCAQEGVQSMLRSYLALYCRFSPRNSVHADLYLTP